MLRIAFGVAHECSGDLDKLRFLKEIYREVGSVSSQESQNSTQSLVIVLLRMPCNSQLHNSED
jgi:hypothetical protein